MAQSTSKEAKGWKLKAKDDNNMCSGVHSLVNGVKSVNFSLFSPFILNVRKSFSFIKNIVECQREIILDNRKSSQKMVDIEQRKKKESDVLSTLLFRTSKK